MTSAFDFTDCPRVSGRAYNGANGKKIAVSFEGAVWLLKFPPNAAEVPNDLSYSNSCFSEHIGCAIFRALGIDVQKTRLGSSTKAKTRAFARPTDDSRSESLSSTSRRSWRKFRILATCRGSFTAHTWRRVAKRCFPVREIRF